MSNIVIQAENISKQYRLGTISTGALSDDLNRFWHKIRGKEDPYLKIGEVNDRTAKGNSEYVWALQNISFSIDEGDLVGIIGRNGAGKSTLLKILSKVTQPTTGTIKTKGRIASLLEVGTGFHPELSGRENIFLNGAILGMRKQEIKRKFDEIVDFSGVERYIDTPVKRYSSGMYVRLAFAVSAHLESEILIVDEVLAVGDLDFQKKCLGKMGDVSEKEGRTVLFVSHNLPTLQKLCRTGLLLKFGQTEAFGDLDSVLEKYKENDSITRSTWLNQNISANNSPIKILSARLLNEDGTIKDVFEVHESIHVVIDFEITQTVYNGIVAANVHTLDDVHLLSYEDGDADEASFAVKKEGFYSIKIQIDQNILNKGIYYIRLSCGSKADGVYMNERAALIFELINSTDNPLITNHRKGLLYSNPSNVRFISKV